MRIEKLPPLSKQERIIFLLILAIYAYIGAKFAIGLTAL